MAKFLALIYFILFFVDFNVQNHKKTFFLENHLKKLTKKSKKFYIQKVH